MKPEEKSTKPVPKAAKPAEQPQNVQYIKMEKSLEGVGGWLAFWLVVFGLGGVGMIMTFFGAISAANIGASVVTTLIFSPLLAVGFVATAVLIALRKKLAVMMAYISLGLSALYSIVGSIVAYNTVNEVVDDVRHAVDYYGGYTSSVATSSMTLPVLVGSILATIVGTGLIALYFYQSKRVKATLTK